MHICRYASLMYTNKIARIGGDIAAATGPPEQDENDENDASVGQMDGSERR